MHLSGGVRSLTPLSLSSQHGCPSSLHFRESEEGLPGPWGHEPFRSLPLPCPQPPLPQPPPRLHPPAAAEPGEELRPAGPAGPGGRGEQGSLPRPSPGHSGLSLSGGECVPSVDCEPQEDGTRTVPVTAESWYCPARARNPVGAWGVPGEWKAPGSRNSYVFRLEFLASLQISF